uniref:Uncharacterized protein n=1 Tax=Setaria digitata TaxID=48799 RepID=A0A915PNC2_9BILA
MEGKDAAAADCRKTSATQPGYRKRVMRRVNEDSHTQEPVARRRSGWKLRAVHDNVLLIKIVGKIEKLIRSLIFWKNARRQVTFFDTLVGYMKFKLLK